MDEKKSSLAIPAAIIICLLIVVGAFYYQSKNPNQTPKNDNNLPAELSQLIPAAQGIEIANFRPVDATDKIRGSINAPIKLVVYTDLECPACKYYHTQLKSIEAKYVAAGPVAIIYRDFPLDQLHPQVRTEFLAAECVNETGGLDKYWQFIDTIFEITKSNNGLELAKLGETAKALNIDTKTFETCMTSKKYADKIQRSVDEAMKLGAPGTPTSVLVDGKGNLIPITVALPAETLSAVFDILLGTEAQNTETTPTATTTIQ